MGQRKFRRDRQLSRGRNIKVTFVTNRSPIKSDDVERVDFRYFRLEGQYQFPEDGKAGFDSALRAELQIADGDDPASRVRLCWTNKYDINDDWQIRGIFITRQCYALVKGNGGTGPKTVD